MIWTLGRDGSVVRCSWKCERKHEHFTGTYEKAQMYFLGRIESEVGNKKLKDIIIFHQLDERTLTKSSAELYDILMQACSTKDYWVPEDERHDSVMQALHEAEDEYLILDDAIFAKTDENSPERMKKRLYKLQKWKKNIQFM